MILYLLLAFVVLATVRYLKPLIEWVSEIQRKRRYMRNVPGPENLPFIGSVHKIPTEPEKLLSFLLEEMNKVLEQGESIFKIWVGPKLVVLPLDAETIRPLTSSNVEIDKGEDYVFHEQWLGRGLLLGTGDYWQKIRKMVTPTFHFGKIDEYTEIMDAHTRMMVQLIGERAEKTDREIDIYPLLKNCSLDIIGEAAMGIQLNALSDPDQPYVKAVAEFNRLAIVYWRSPHLWFFNGILWKLLGYKAETDATLEVLKSTTTKVIKERMEVYEDYRQNGTERIEKKRLNFLDLMLEYKKQDEITMEQLREEVDTFMFAGHDTTSHAVSWAIWCLATNPQIQDQLYGEIVKEFGNSDVEFRTTRLKDLKYLDMVFKESMRVFAPVPFFQRKLRNDLEMGGHVIPRNTSVSVSPFLLHRNPKVFPQPHKFNPENFAEGKEYASTAYLPFSAGPRNCIGQKFAVREAKIMIAHLVFNFRFTTHHQMHENLPSAETVSRPSLGVPVKVEPRN